MNREFLELYNRELRLLEENAREFAEEFPGVAERLGGLTYDAMDPMIKGMLEGAAFLAARVQLKLKHEFSEFTNNLLEQLLPHYLAPIPSTMMIAFTPPFDDPNLAIGRRIPAGSYLDARYVERERRVSCRFRISSSVTLWPVDVMQAEFHGHRASLATLGIEPPPDVMSGLQLTLRRRSALRAEDEPKDEEAALKPELLFASCRADDLTFHISTNEADAIRLYEKLFANCREIYVRYLDSFGNPVLVKAPLSCLRQIGFEAGETLLPGDNRLFRGFDFLRDLFILPQKFLGFRLTGLQKILPAVKSRLADIVFLFNKPDARLASVVNPPMFVPYAAPAVNLFEMQTSRIPVRTNEYEHQIVPDRGRNIEFETHRVLKLFAHFVGVNEKLELVPLYSPPPAGLKESDLIYYTTRRLMRRRTSEERRFGKVSNYTGTDTFVTVVAAPSALDGRQIAELSARAIVSNRHLTEHLPVGQGGADFILEADTKLQINCFAGPTRPRESIVDRPVEQVSATPRRTVAWRLISMLSLNHLGLTGRGTENSASALREFMNLIADSADAAAEERIRGLGRVESQPAVRRMSDANGTAVVRGLEVTLNFNEKAYEDSGLFLYGAILERFLAEYAPVNNFVQTVVRSDERGEVMRWPPRAGGRVTL